VPAIKLTIIGAGSAFTFHVMSDLARQPALAGSTVALIDTDAEALGLSERIAARMVEAAGAQLNIQASTDRRRLLPGSDFVLITISVGEPWARERDVAIAEEYGIYQPTSQTVGPAGFTRGLRVVPPAVEIGHDIAALCPQAVVLDLANPLSAVCRALTRECGLRVIGLCEQWWLAVPPLAQVLGVEAELLEVFPAGINHLTFALSAIHQGRNLLPEALRRLYAPDGADALAALPVSRAVYDAFGLWPLGTEAHIAEFFPYFLTDASGGGDDYGLSIRHTTAAQQEARREERLAWAEGREPVGALLQPSGESAVPIIASLAGVTPPAWHVVNVPNAGLIDNLPAEAIVELPAWVDPTGVRGAKVGPLPQPLAHLLATRAVQQELLIDAALSGDRTLALRGLLLDAQVTSLEAAGAILERSLAAGAAWLPRFHPTES